MSANVERSFNPIITSSTFLNKFTAVCIGYIIKSFHRCKNVSSSWRTNKLHKLPTLKLAAFTELGLRCSCSERETNAPFARYKLRRMASFSQDFIAVYERTSKHSPAKTNQSRKILFHNIFHIPGIKSCFHRRQSVYQSCFILFLPTLHTNSNFKIIIFKHFRYAALGEGKAGKS